MGQFSPAEGHQPELAPREPVNVNTAAPAPGPDPDRIFNYTTALKFLNDRMNVERARPARIPPEAFKLDRTAALLEHLGNPHHDIRCIHIAGSKGKGSTVEMVAAALTACGYAAGVYTSPHLFDVRERIRINDSLIGYSAFARLMQRIAEAVAAIAPEHGDATYFEVVTALAFCYFAEQAVDVAVIEVGLGGRLDCTNLIVPEVAAITSIQLEHTQLLGDTLAKIAREKAGIIKPGIPVITVPQEPEVMDIFRQIALERNAPLHIVGEDIEYSSRFVASTEKGPQTRISVGWPKGARYDHIAVPLKGEHQALNCALALAILLQLQERGLEIPERHVVEGLARTLCAGRMEIVPGTPRILLDGAHTPESIKALVRAIGSHIRYDSMVVIMGCPDDKDVHGILRNISLGADKIIFTRAAGSPRAMEPRQLVQRYSEVTGKMAQAAPDLRQALQIARAAAQRDDLICITGSFHLVGEARKLLQQSTGQR